MPLWRNFIVTNMSSDAIRENKILAKISGFTVFITDLSIWNQNSYIGVCKLEYGTLPQAL